ncbi:hypothetical protein [Tateyamaria omphalii]|uniref:hypothetical protein n=1 Tax=Tateyamaria omphalii TaxID=299262 RepID=UPI0012F75A2E|nr:hypothetical protein [Tateyamaria omphalii]
MLFLYQKGACSSKKRDQAGTGAPLYWVKLLGAGTVCVSALALTGQAQEVPEGAQRITLDVRTGLEWSDNPDLVVDGDSRFVSRTRLDFALERRTDIDRLTFGAAGDVVLGEDTDDVVENPEFRLRWDRDVGRSRLGAGLTYESIELDSTGFADGVSADSVDFSTFDGGTRRLAGIDVDGAWGVGGPLGATYSLSQDRITYDGTDDPTLLDADSRDFRFALTGALDRTTTLGLIGSYSEFDEDGAGALDTRSVRLGGELRSEITQTMTGRFALGWQEAEETGADTTQSEGVFVDGELTWALPNGTAGIVWDSPIEVDRRRTTVRFQRSLELPRGGLGYSIGASRAAGLGTRPLVGLNWEYEMPRARFVADLSQTPATTRDNVQTINSVLSLNFNQQLTSRGNLDVLFTVRDGNEDGEGAVDNRRVGLDVTYRHDLAQDWDLVGQFSSVHVSEDDAEDRSSNTIFIGLEKRFGWN